MKIASPDSRWSKFLLTEYEKPASREFTEVSWESFSLIIFSKTLPKGDTVINNFRTDNETFPTLQV